MSNLHRDLTIIRTDGQTISVRRSVAAKGGYEPSLTYHSYGVTLSWKAERTLTIPWAAILEVNEEIKNN